MRVGSYNEIWIFLASSLSAETAFRLRWLHQLVCLHHAVVGEAAVVFIILATPRERCVATSTSA